MCIGEHRIESNEGKCVYFRTFGSRTRFKERR